MLPPIYDPQIFLFFSLFFVKARHKDLPKVQGAEKCNFPRNSEERRVRNISEQQEYLL